ncbi:MAG: RloB family protein [Bacteroidota bacterium]
MARKIKIDNAILKRRARKDRKRKIEIRKKRLYYLIVCEGEKTEPHYFQSLKENLPKGVLSLTNIDIDGTGKNTLSIIEEAQQLRAQYEKEYLRTIDKVWAVFDKDSFPDKNFNNAIFKGENSKPKIYCAWTNEAFELWYLLHFNYYHTGISRTQYQEKLEQEINKAANTTDYKYVKNAENIYELLAEYGSLSKAIKNAKKLETLYENQSYAKYNPCTKVHHLVEELNALKEELSSSD